MYVLMYTYTYMYVCMHVCGNMHHTYGYVVDWLASYACMNVCMYCLRMYVKYLFLCFIVNILMAENRPKSLSTIRTSEESKRNNYK